VPGLYEASPGLLSAYTVDPKAPLELESPHRAVGTRPEVAGDVGTQREPGGGEAVLEISDGFAAVIST